MPEAVVVAEAVASTTGPRESRRPWTVRPHALRRLYKKSLGTDESGNATLVVTFTFAGQASKATRLDGAAQQRGSGQGDTALPARAVTAKERRDARRNTREAFEARMMKRLKEAQAVRAAAVGCVENTTTQMETASKMETPKRRATKAVDGKRQAIEAAIEMIVAAERMGAEMATTERFAIKTTVGKRRAIESMLAGTTVDTTVGATTGTTVGATAGATTAGATAGATVGATAATATHGATTVGRSKKAGGLRARAPMGIVKAKGAQEAHMDYIYKELTRGERMHRMVRASAAI